MQCTIRRSTEIVTLAVLLAVVALSAMPAYAGDAFLCYKTRPPKGAAAFAKTTVSVTDDAGAKSLDLKKGRTLCTPADLGGGVADPGTFLRGYRSRLSKGLPKYAEEVGVKVSNQLGDLFVDRKKQPKMLLVPTSVGPSQPPPDPALHSVDHYRCHKAKIPKGAAALPAGTQVTASDMFSVAKTFDLIKPTQLCTPVDVEGVAVKDPAGSLLCYRARRAKGEPKHIPVAALEINNLLGVATLDTVKEVEVCLPSRAVARCNGFVELCDRGFEQIAHPTTHNAMSNAEEGWLGPNQNFSITHQLEDGVRAVASRSSSASWWHASLRHVRRSTAKSWLAPRSSAPSLLPRWHPMQPPATRACGAGPDSGSPVVAATPPPASTSAADDASGVGDSSSGAWHGRQMA